MTRDPNALFDELSRAIADGEAIDWSGLQSDGDPEIRAVIEQLRVLEDVSRLHRDTLPDDGGTAPLPPPPLQPGDFWGHLTIRDVLGRGAHSHVYRAWDPRLERDVALKLTVDADRERGEKDIIREARLLARVRHPNVATLFGAERRAGLVGLWMELIDGETLEDLLSEVGRFNAREAALIGTDVCAALSAVHAAGLLHRDVKAQNVMRDRDGRIVLMDLGTGRDAAPGPDAFVHDQVGTPLYMAPELFDGAKATVQSDIYSVGVLLYRLVTGGVPVEARSPSSLQLAHRRNTPRPMTDLRSDLPLAFTRVVERALSADPSERYASAGALSLALATVHTPDASAVVAPRPRWSLLLAALGGVVMGLLLAAGWWWATPPQVYPGVRFDLPPSEGEAMESLAFSADGQRLAYTSGGRLRVRALNDVRSSALEPALGARDPFWSPDGQWLAFFGGTSLWRVSSSGSVPHFVAQARRPAGGSWGAGGALVFSVENGMALMTVPASGGTPRTLREQVPGVRSRLWWPSLLADGTTFVYSAFDDHARRRKVFLGRLSDPPTTIDAALLDLESNPVAAGNRLFYVIGGQLRVQRVDVEAGRLLEPVVALAHDVGNDPYGQGEVELAVSRTGAVAYVPAMPDERTVRLVDSAMARSDDLVSGDIRDLRVSPDGTMLAYEQHDADAGTRDIWVLDLQRRSRVRVSQHPAHDISPTWSPDSRWLYYLSRRGANDALVMAPAHGGGSEQVRFVFDARALPFQITPDGHSLVYEQQGQETGWDIWMRGLDGASPTPLLRGPANEQEPAVSPDGRWLAYSSPESEGRQVYVLPLHGGTRRRVSRQHGRQPLWSADGRTLYFHGHDRQLMRVSLDTRGEVPVIGQPAPLLVLPVRGYDVRYHYGLVPDGSHFFLNVPSSVARPVPARVILNAALP